jgi:hypothetical protein
LQWPKEGIFSIARLYARDELQIHDISPIRPLGGPAIHAGWKTNRILTEFLAVSTHFEMDNLDNYTTGLITIAC